MLMSFSVKYWMQWEMVNICLRLLGKDPESS
jgi:hypothetical protein